MLANRRVRHRLLLAYLVRPLVFVLLLTGCGNPFSKQTTTPTYFSTFSQFIIRDQGSQLTGITAGPDGTIWFTELASQRIGRISPSQTIMEFPLSEPPGDPQSITEGPDGALWFTGFNGDQIGRITPTGTFTTFPLPGSASGTEDITTGPDGALWFTVTGYAETPTSDANRTGSIGRITIHGIVTLYPLPAPNTGPQGITVGPDGALWFTELAGNKIGRITLAGNITEFSIPTADSEPRSIAAGPDGALWFTEFHTNKIGRITSAGDIAEFSIPMGGAPWGITAAPDGALWFTEGAGTILGRVTTAGVFAHPSLPTCCGEGEAVQQSLDPRGITLGPDHALWFTEAGVSRIARIGFALPSAHAISTTAW